MKKYPLLQELIITEKLSNAEDPLIDGKYTQKDYDYMSENTFNERKNPIVKRSNFKKSRRSTI